MSSPLIPLVENRYKLESALRFTKQKGDARTVLDSKKIKNYKLSGSYAQKSRMRCWRVPRVVVKNEYFVEVIKTSKPQLKQKGKEGKKEEEEEDLDTLSKGPPVLDMYADPISDSDDQSQPKHRHDVTADNWGSRTSTPDNESLHFATDSESQDTEDQLMPTKDEAPVVLGKGTGGRKRSFVRSSYNRDLTRSGIQPQRVKTEKRMPYFN
ncbi:uncharacterized protein LOC142338264 [Convolutriloba macropyga]|uniref:uncharacterized protein LOC142338264 n=1 Tax=Convolutriloba macropyga TaxID=536237 RepID=UPI003F51BF41